MYVGTLFYELCESRVGGQKDIVIRETKERKENKHGQFAMWHPGRW